MKTMWRVMCWFTAATFLIDAVAPWVGWEMSPYIYSWACVVAAFFMVSPDSFSKEP